MAMANPYATSDISKSKESQNILKSACMRLQTLIVGVSRYNFGHSHFSAHILGCQHSAGSVSLPRFHMVRA